MGAENPVAAPDLVSHPGVTDIADRVGPEPAVHHTACFPCVPTAAPVLVLKTFSELAWLTTTNEGRPVAMTAGRAGEAPAVAEITVTAAAVMTAIAAAEVRSRCFTNSP
jgi:hypothetical protein